MGKRPAHVKPPAYLSANRPVPQPAPAKAADDPAQDPPKDPLGQDPTRFGDWTLKGIAIDF